MVTSQSSTCGFTAITLAAGLAFLLPDNGALAGSPGYDGVYKGQVTLTRGEAGFCGRSPIGVTKQVVNGQFSLVYDQSHNIGINLEVQPDGSFSGKPAICSGGSQAAVTDFGVRPHRWECA